MATEKIRFVEHARPTIITIQGADLPSSGTVWVAAADGAVIKTTLEHNSAELSLEAVLEVTFQRDEKLAMWVPSRMDERYTQEQVGWIGMPARAVIVSERITCEATYPNFRRFETGACIVP